jgi:hypothetical protein
VDAVKSGEVVVVRAVNCGAWGKSRFAYPLLKNLQRTSLCLSPMKYSVLHLTVRWDGFWLQHNACDKNRSLAATTVLSATVVRA